MERRPDPVTDPRAVTRRASLRNHQDARGPSETTGPRPPAPLGLENGPSRRAERPWPSNRDAPRTPGTQSGRGGPAAAGIHRLLDPEGDGDGAVRPPGGAARPVPRSGQAPAEEAKKEGCRAQEPEGGGGSNEQGEDDQTNADWRRKMREAGRETGPICDGDAEGDGPGHGPASVMSRSTAPGRSEATAPPCGTLPSR